MPKEVGKKSPLVVGVLALQGAFAKHMEILRNLGVHALEVRKPEDLDKCQGLIIPGGESTTMYRQLDFIKMKDPLHKFAQQKPIFGTCAGLILMSEKIIADPMQPFGWLNVVVERNAFGRQAESFIADLDVQFPDLPSQKISAIFIRAPRIRSVDTKLKVLAEYQGEPVLVQKDHFLGATFHPELTQNSSIHAYFVKLVSDTI